MTASDPPPPDDTSQTSETEPDGSTTGSPNQHWICEHCWYEQEAERGGNDEHRWPHMIRPDTEFLDGIPAWDVAFTCCTCGHPCHSHILVHDHGPRPHCSHDDFFVASNHQDLVNGFLKEPGSMDDQVGVLVGCMPRIEGDEPPAPSIEADCFICDGPVWVSEQMVEGLRASGNKGAYVCVSCMPDDDDVPATVPHWQREELNNRGLSDETIDKVMRQVNSGLFRSD